MYKSKYEYSYNQELDFWTSNYYMIPESIILKCKVQDKLAAVFSYFSLRAGLDKKVRYTINDILKWLNKTIDRHPKGMNSIIAQIIKELHGGGYLTLSEEPKNTVLTEVVYNSNKIIDECKNSYFATIYPDEVEKIINYKNLIKMDNYVSNEIVLLVFTYLRMMIFRRRNELFPEEVNIKNNGNILDDIAERRKKYPEAYDCNLNDISNVLGLSERVVSKSINILSKIGLIYFETLPRKKYNNKWYTQPTIFCNAYKREGNYLLASGEDYYLTELENKKIKMNIKN